MPLVSLDRVSLAFGHPPLLEEATLQIDRGEKVAVVGRNGSGKSTLLRIVSGEQRPIRGNSVQPIGHCSNWRRSGRPLSDRVGPNA
jgi:ATPase subunit of ABC transporter with duplicated ATPase domains